MAHIELQNEAIQVDKLYQLLKSPEFGAICSFVGTVREWTADEHTESIDYTAYSEMALKELNKLAEPIEKAGSRVVIVHRLGLAHISEEVVFVGVASAHRQQAFEAAQFIMDEIKKRVPIWKKELDTSEDGQVERWGK